MAATTSSSICCLSRMMFRQSASRTTASLKGANYTTTYRTAHLHTSARPSTIAQQTQRLPSFARGIVARSASTSASSATSSAPSTASASQSSQTTLTWDEFLKLRRTRRYVNLVASVFSGVSGIVIATPLIAEFEIENIGAQLTGLDPMFVIGGSLMAAGGVGWLMGPFVGTAVFKIWKSSVAQEFARKEKVFYGHIKRYRADPASSSVNNPVPDYYGEKIGSVADYKRWLKDQRAFNRKKNKNMI